MLRSRYEYWLFVVFVVAACADDAKYGHRSFSGIQSNDTGRSCVDQDSDGYGVNCTFGIDCDDADPEVTNQCFRCAHITQGCPCEPGQPAIPCFPEPTQMEEGRVVCKEGTRFCREGKWSDCESVRSYLAIESDQSTALIDPDAGVPQCNVCNPNCYRVSDPLDSVEGGIGSDICTNVCWAEGGGIRLTTDNETDICHNNEPEPPEPPICIAADPESGTPGSDPQDDDCDGIPNVYDPEPNQRPFDTTHQAIFARLGPGDIASTTLELELQAPATDLYFLLDQSQTMSDERDAFLATLDSAYACEADSDCPGICLDGRCFGSDAACSSDSECFGFCTDNSCRFLDDTNACRDIDADGSPNDELKSQGILGTIRCMIDQSRFGAGYFNELPIEPYSDFYDESVYQHLSNIGQSDDATLLDRLNSVQSYTAVSSDYPQAQTQALWSIATAGSLQLGVDRPSVKAANRCYENGFGYPCFSQNALPVVLMLTDSPFHNGSLDLYDYRSFLPITIDPEDLVTGDLIEIPGTNDAVYYAFNAGLLSGDYVGLRGNTSTMTGFLSAQHLGCSGDDRVKDAYFTFAVNNEQRLTFSTRNSAFDTTLSLFRELTVDNTNETVSDAFDIDRQLGADIRGRRIKLIGNTSDMRSDYPPEVVGADADNQMNDAVFKFSIAEETTVRIDTEGSEIGMLFALYDGATDLTGTPVASAGTLTTTAPESCCYYSEFNRRGYWVCRRNKSFYQASSICSSKGMSLVTIDDADENNFIKSKLYWNTHIAANDTENEGQWRWGDTGEHFWTGGPQDGYSVNGRYSNWKYGEPNNGYGRENCAEMDYGSGEWNDIPCGEDRDYVCETPLFEPIIQKTLAPGDYYIVVKGEGTQGGGRYTLTIQDVSATETSCNNDSGSLQTSEMTATLEPGNYLLVLSGNAVGDEGDYELHIWSQSYSPRTWDQAITALQNHRIRVTTLLSCNHETHPSGDSACDDAFDDASQLAIATKATGEVGQPLAYRVEDSSRIPAGIVAAVQQLVQSLTFDVGLRIVPDPDANPFVSTINAVETEEPHECGGFTEAAFLNCSKASRPQFALQFANPDAPDNVADETRGYAFKIQIVGDDNYVIDEIPAYIVAEPESVPQGDPYSAGTYLQDVDSSGCEATMRPDWHTLQWSADVPPGTRIVFEVCTSETEEGLEDCAYQRVAAVTAFGSELEVTGGECEDDTDCSPLKDCESGDCTFLAQCLGDRCVYNGQKADVGFALGATNNFRKFMRLKVDLHPDTDTRLRTPTLHNYQLDYVCTDAE